MRRAFHGKTCAYCGCRPADTGDHVIGRSFFPRNLRDDLPQVPACAQCNGEKADLERYAMTILPMGSEDSRTQQYARETFGRRLDKDKRLLNDLQKGVESVVWRRSSGIVHPGMALPVDESRLSKLYEMITKGLICYHVGQPLPSDYLMTVFSLTDTGLALFKHHILSLSPDQLKNCSMADGLFQYQCTFNPEDRFFSVWVFELYGDLNICGLTDDRQAKRVHPAVVVLPPGQDDLMESLRSVISGPQDPEKEP